MSYMKKAMSIAAVGCLTATGMAAFATGASAAVTPVGACAGLKALGTAKSTILGDGITDKDNQNVSIVTKGVDPLVNLGTNLGVCIYNTGLSTPDSAVPPVKGYNGVHSITKWATKLYSPESDCNTTDVDPTEWPLNGTLSATFSDFTVALIPKLQATTSAIVVDGFSDPDNNPATPSDVVIVHGVVTKGVAAGADIQGETYFDPTIKNPLQLTNNPYFGYDFNIGGAIGCTTPAPGDANILSFVNGSGTSLLLALPVAPLTFSIGS